MMISSLLYSLPFFFHHHGTSQARSDRLRSERIQGTPRKTMYAPDSETDKNQTFLPTGLAEPVVAQSIGAPAMPIVNANNPTCNMSRRLSANFGGDKIRNHEPSYVYCLLSGWIISTALYRLYASTAASSKPNDAITAAQQ